uniref:Carboxylesterase type B domain-containing protein n=1 Tax=Phlebotomus papatasi TaxID=29031 RepID=A0A1B0D6H7_PHLPP
LAHRAILLSGSALSPWAIIPNPDRVREEVSQQMACHLDTSGVKKNTKDVTEDVSECLKSKPLEALMGVRLETVSPHTFSHPISICHQNALLGNFGEFQDSLFVIFQLDFHAKKILKSPADGRDLILSRRYASDVKNTIHVHMDSTMEALSDGHTVAPLIKTGYLHARRGAKTYLFHFGYQTKDSEYPQYSLGNSHVLARIILRKIGHPKNKWQTKNVWDILTTD